MKDLLVALNKGGG